MGRLIPLILKPFIFPSSTRTSNLISPHSSPAPPIPAKSNTRPQPEVPEKIPYEPHEWRDFLDEVKRMYVKGQYEQCSTRCTQVLDNVRGPVRPLQLVFIGFYAASSFELTARSLPVNSVEKIPIFIKSRTYYWHANSLMSQAIREQSAGTDCQTSKSYKRTIPRMWARKTSTTRAWNTISSKKSVSSGAKSTLLLPSSRASSRGSSRSLSTSSSPSSSRNFSNSSSPSSSSSFSNSSSPSSSKTSSSPSSLNSSRSANSLKRHSGYILVRRRSRTGKQSPEFSPSLPTVVSVGDINYSSSPVEPEDPLSPIDDAPIPSHLPSFCSLTSKSSASGTSDVFFTRRTRSSSSTPSSRCSTPRVATHSESLATYLLAIRQTDSTTPCAPPSHSSPSTRYAAELDTLSKLISQHIQSINSQISAIKAARNNRLSYRSAFHRDLATVNDLVEMSRAGSMSSLNVEVGIMVTENEAKAARWRLRTEELKARGEERKKKGSWDGARYKKLCEVVLTEIEGRDVHGVDGRPLRLSI